MSELQTGDRVRYTGKSSLYSDPTMIGYVGTVQSIAGDKTVYVRWDSEPHRTPGHFRANLEKIVKPTTLVDTKPVIDLAVELEKQAAILLRQADQLKKAAGAFRTFATLSNTLAV